MRRGHLDQHGMGLVEVMVALGILGVVVAGSATMIDQILQRLKYSEAKVGQLSLAQDVRSQVSKSQSCINSLRSRQFSNGMTFSLDFNTNPSAPLLVTSGANLNSTYNVTVDQFTHDNASVVATIAGGGTLYLGDLSLQVSSGVGASKVSFKKSTPSKLYLEVSATGAITNCYGDLLSSNGNTPNPALTCSALGGTMSGNTCHLSTPAETCADLGGTVSSGACRLPASTPTAPPPPPVLGHWVRTNELMSPDYPQCPADWLSTGQVCSPVGIKCTYYTEGGRWHELDCQ